MNILTSVLLIASLNRAYTSYHNNGVGISGDRAKKFLVNDHLYGSCNLTIRLSTAELMVPLNAVAFNARHTQDITPAHLAPLTFDDVVFNLGQAYRNGVFVAPYSGLYLFLVSLCSNGRTRIIYSLVSSAHEICSLEVGGSIVNACSIGTSITELQAGDVVSVVHRGDKFDLTRGIPHDLNSFTGVLLGLK